MLLTASLHHTATRAQRGCSLQVPHEGQFLSCCAVVAGVMRSLFVVPHPDVLAAAAEDIRAAQQEADADPTTRGHLVKTLHVRGLLQLHRAAHSIRGVAFFGDRGRHGNAVCSCMTATLHGFYMLVRPLCCDGSPE